MKVQKLVVEYDYDFELYGISTPIKDYKLAWRINDHLNISLMRAEDHQLGAKDKQLQLINYKYSTDHTELRLFKNKTVLVEGEGQGYMVPEHKHYDFFITLNGKIHTFAGSELLNQFRMIEQVQLVNVIDIETLKSREHFLF